MPSSIRSSVLPALLCLSLAACQGRSFPLDSTFASARDASAAVLLALEHRDSDALGKLVLNEQEFRDHVWPELPASRPERNLPFSYVWGDLHQKSTAALAVTLANHAGRHYELLDVRFAGESTQYPSYTVHRKATVRVRSGEGGEQELRLFGSLIEKDGRWKVFSYVTD